MDQVSWKDNSLWRMRIQQIEIEIQLHAVEDEDTLIKKKGVIQSPEKKKIFLKVAYQDPLVEFVQSVSIGKSFPCRLTQFSSRLNNDTHGLYITLSTAIIGGEKKERGKKKRNTGLKWVYC